MAPSGFPAPPTSSIPSASPCSSSASSSSTTFPGSSPILLPIFLPLFHSRHRNHHLGRQKLQIAPHLQLQAHEGSQSRQADEIRLGNPSARALGEKIRQAPHPKTRRPPRTHPPRLHQRRRLRPRSLPRRSHHSS